jgi:hypothetical protein
MVRKTLQVAGTALIVHAVIHNDMHKTQHYPIGSKHTYIYIHMKPTDRIFQQTNDTSDVSFFDEYIDMNLLIFLIFILHRIKYTIENAENHIYIIIYIHGSNR